MKRLRSALWLSVLLAGALATEGCAVLVPAISALGSVVTLASSMNAYTKNGSGRSAGLPGLADAEAESYRQGIRDTLEKLQKNGGLPVVASPRQPENLYYVGPVMQEVWLPAQVVGGMVIPAHRQWVVVRPGTWQVPTPSGSAPSPASGKQGPL